MRTDDIARAFAAIVEEAQRLQGQDLPEDAHAIVKTIISIAKHQNDIRQSSKGSCKAGQ
jgi:hypothetical protein